MRNHKKALKMQLLRMFIDSYAFFLSYFFLDVCRVIQSAYSVAIPIVFANFFLADVLIIVALRKRIINFKKSDVFAYYFFIVSLFFSVIMTGILYSVAIKEN